MFNECPAVHLHSNALQVIRVHGAAANSVFNSNYLLPKADDIFGNSGVQICTDGGKYLGGVIGNDNLLCAFVQAKIEEWEKELQTLIDIAQTQPQAAYAAFTHGIMSKWN